MAKTGKKHKKAEYLWNKGETGGKVPGSNMSEQPDIEETRSENRREADLEDKPPPGDAGVEDNVNDDQRKKRSTDGSINY